MKLLKENIKFPDFELSDNLKKFLNLDEVKEAFQSFDIQEIYKLYESFTRNPYMNTDITKLLFNLDINPVDYFIDNIPAYCFYSMDINPVKLNNYIQSIGDGAFRYNNSIDSVSIPDSCKIIGEYAFSYCLNLQAVALGNNVQEIGKDCFEYSDKLTYITLPKSLQSINLNTFSKSNITDLSFTSTADEFVQKLENKTLIGLDVKITEVNCSDKVLYLKKYFNDPELIQPDITNATGLFRIRTSNSYTLTARKYDPKSDTFGFGWTANQGVVHSSEITFTTEKEATNFIEKANLQSDIKLGRTNKPYDLYKVNTQAGPCYLTKQYIEWLFLDTVMNNRDLNKKLPPRLIIRP